MYVICLDVEGVLIPEIWINFAEKTNINELRLTTRDINDYNVLMKKRLSILKEHNLKLKDIQEVISEMDPLEGAKDFLRHLRSKTQVFLLSDTFVEFATPLMAKLDYPTLLCNFLETDGEGNITNYRLRQDDGKRKAVLALKSMNYDVVASGDSYNDITMLKEADKGILFSPPENVINDYPEFPVTRDYDSLTKEFEKYIP